MYRKPQIGLDCRAQLGFQLASELAGDIIGGQHRAQDRFHCLLSLRSDPTVLGPL
ncbi:hypothetical protein [Ruegeria sp. ANG-R]|uniref:hypothetical protein n=1 Tax=Ruegeria sp. ANG-R TaxID=1577903 RepID=UPI0019D33530|nr:hypothetical protein [Ruegeria sp. ANG-R]